MSKHGTMSQSGMTGDTMPPNHRIAQPVNGGRPLGGQVDSASLQPHLGYLYRFGLALARDPEMAREAVQEALVCALENLASFEGRSSLRSWLASIVKHQIIDLQREATRRVAIDFSPDWESDEESAQGELAHGATRDFIVDGRTPEQAMEARELWNVVGRCLSGMPEKRAQAFVLRVLMGEPLGVACKAADAVSMNACSAMLWRVKACLRRCLVRAGYMTSCAPAENCCRTSRAGSAGEGAASQEGDGLRRKKMRGG